MLNQKMMMNFTSFLQIITLVEVDILSKKLWSQLVNPPKDEGQNYGIKKDKRTIHFVQCIDSAYSRGVDSVSMRHQWHQIKRTIPNKASRN